MSDDQFTKLFKYMEDRFAAIDARFAAVDRRFDQIFGLFDARLKKEEADDQERAILKYQLDHHQAWIDKAAPVVRVPYRPSG